MNRRFCRALRPCLIATLALVLLLASGCGGTGSGGSQLTVFAAASLAAPFEIMAKEFEAANPGVSVRLNFAGSQRLRSQLELGAQADVFASADERQMRLAEAAGLVAGVPRTFATNRLAVLAAVNEGDQPVENLPELARPGVKLALAHSSVPAGAYAREMLNNLSAPDGGFGEGFAEKALANLVSEETNVSTVEQRVLLGEADAGIVYHTGAVLSLASGNVAIVPIPAQANVTALYPISVLADAESPRLAAEFVDFVLGEVGQEILRRFGFGPS